MPPLAEIQRGVLLLHADEVASSRYPAACLRRCDSQERAAAGEEACRRRELNSAEASARRSGRVIAPPYASATRPGIGRSDLRSAMLYSTSDEAPPLGTYHGIPPSKRALLDSAYEVRGRGCPLSS